MPKPSTPLTHVTKTQAFLQDPRSILRLFLPNLSNGSYLGSLCLLFKDALCP